MAFDKPLYEFNEETDLKKYKVWVLGTQWTPPPLFPLFTDLHFTHGKYGMQWSAEKLSMPTSKGWDWRLYKGGWYLSIIEPTEEERRQREPVWREKMRKILEDPSAPWQQYKSILKEKLPKFLAFDLAGASNEALCSHWLEVWNFNKLVEEAHFYPMYALGQADITFREMLKRLLNISPADLDYETLHSGFENDYLTAVEKLGDIANLAIDLGLQDTFRDSSLDELLPKLATTKNGKQWSESFNEFVRQYGYMRRRGGELCTPTWQEDNMLPLADIQRYVTIGKRIRSVEMRPRLASRRKELERELLSRVPQEEREIFQKLMFCSQALVVYVVEHNLYVEMMMFSAVRLAAMEFGRRFANKGILDSPDDIMFLHHDEILHAGIIQDRSNLTVLVNNRKEEYNNYRKLETTWPMFLGDPTKIGELAASDVIFTVAMAPRVATPEEVGATLVGCAGAPGVVEGEAIVCMGEGEMDKIKPGMILVTPATTASWTPVFNVIKGVVTDGGGYLTHALIAAREFGIPGVVGTQEATKKIKSGQKIRVDGNLCRVYALESSA